MDLLVVSGGTVVIAGGQSRYEHPFDESTPILESILNGAGHDVTVTEDPSVLADASRMSGYDALVFNTMRAGDNSMTRAERAGMTKFIEDGKGFVCIHVASAPPKTGRSTTTSRAAAGSWGRAPIRPMAGSP